MNGCLKPSSCTENFGYETSLWIFVFINTQAGLFEVDEIYHKKSPLRQHHSFSKECHIKLIHFDNLCWIDSANNEKENLVAEFLENCNHQCETI